MIDAAWLANTLKSTPEKMAVWKAQASQLRHLVTTAEAGGTVTDDLLMTTERTCSSIYDEITRSADVIESVAGASEAAASELATLTDALQLLLLEVTELSTELYAMKSRLLRQPAPLIAKS